MSKITFRKYIDIAEQMCTSNNYSLDIKEYDVEEVKLIAILCQNDALFNFFSTVKDMDVLELEAIVELVDAQKKLQRAKAKLIC